MRTFKTMPLDPGHEHYHLWAVIATEEDGTEETIETYATMAEAETARHVLERAEVDINS